MKKLAICVALLAVFAFVVVAAETKPAKCTDCVKAGLCAEHKAAVEKCADCAKAKGLCEKDAKAVDACKVCKKDAKCAKCAHK